MRNVVTIFPLYLPIRFASYENLAKYLGYVQTFATDSNIRHSFLKKKIRKENSNDSTLTRKEQKTEYRPQFAQIYETEIRASFGFARARKLPWGQCPALYRRHHG